MRLVRCLLFASATGFGTPFFVTFALPCHFSPLKDYKQEIKFEWPCFMIF